MEGILGNQVVLPSAVGGCGCILPVSSCPRSCSPCHGFRFRCRFSGCALHSCVHCDAGAFHAWDFLDLADHEKDVVCLQFLYADERVLEDVDGHEFLGVVVYVDFEPQGFVFDLLQGGHDEDFVLVELGSECGDVGAGFAGVVGHVREFGSVELRAQHLDFGGLVEGHGLIGE